jgi:hypothetical protein
LPEQIEDMLDFNLDVGVGLILEGNDAVPGGHEKLLEMIMEYLRQPIALSFLGLRQFRRERPELSRAPLQLGRALAHARLKASGEFFEFLLYDLALGDVAKDL